jgi:hypothetical protein
MDHISTKKSGLMPFVLSGIVCDRMYNQYTRGPPFVRHPRLFIQCICSCPLHVEVSFNMQIEWTGSLISYYLFLMNWQENGENYNSLHDLLVVLLEWEDV